MPGSKKERMDGVLQGRDHRLFCGMGVEARARAVRAARFQKSPKKCPLVSKRFSNRSMGLALRIPVPDAGPKYTPLFELAIER